MYDVADADLEDCWACASTEASRRTLDLARKSLKVPAAQLYSMQGDRRIVRFSADPDLIFEHAAAPSSIAVGLRLSGGREIGGFRVADIGARQWCDQELEILAGLAECLTCQIELKLERMCAEEAEKALESTKTRLLAVADRIPALIFERRKIDAARSAYTFFGSSKTELPAVRQLMEQGGTGDLRFVHRDDRDLVRAALLRSTLEETDLDLTFRIKDFDRGIRWLRSQSIVRHEADGTVWWDGLCFDVSDLFAAREDAPFPVPIPMEKPRLQASGPVAHDRPCAPATRNREGSRILLADDLDLNRKLIADMLSLDGYVVDCVADGAAAVRAAGQKPFDLVLMDMIMPGMDGVTATKAIRALPAPFCDVPIVALTANSGREQLDACLAAGMDATLTKPMSIDALSTVVSTWLRGRNKAA